MASAKANRAVLRAVDPAVRSALKEAHARERREYRRELKFAQREELRTVLSEAAEHGPASYDKKLGSLYRQIAGKGNKAAVSGDTATMTYGSHAVTASTPAQVADAISLYTEEVSADADSPEFDGQFRARTEAYLAEVGASPGGEDDTPLTAAEISAALKKVRTKLFKAPGADGLSYWALVWAGEGLVSVLRSLYGAVWRTQALPEQWLHSNVTYLYKGKGSKREMSNYRPISLMSVLGKLMTTALLPRLARQLSGHLALPQGCAKEGAGATEHLWAFLSLVREQLRDGREVHAFFADVHKAYDQVWRQGLYVALHAMGVRGAMLSFIRGWLDGAVATPKWNGTVGRNVKLAQGLRQGCVLSPLLYCAFINMLLMKRPDSAVAETPPQHAFLDEFFSSGLQQFTHAAQGGSGVQSAFLASPTPCTLYMDDTTLMATTKPGLESLIAAYARFCSKFRMRVNHAKSKVLTFGGRQPLQRGACVSGVQYPAAEGSHKFLGFVADPAATGALHVSAAVRKAKAQLAVSDAVSRRLGTRLTTKYVATHVAPSVLYAAEFATAPAVATKLDREHAKFVASSMGLQPPGQWWRQESPLRLGTMLWHQPHVSWSVQVKLNAARTAARLAQAERSADSLAGALRRGQRAAGYVDPVVGVGEAACAQWGLPARRPLTKAGCARWKNRATRRARGDHAAGLARFAVAAMQEGGRPSDCMMRATLSSLSDQDACWAEVFPDAARRRVLYRAKLGAFPNARVPLSRRHPRWSSVPAPGRAALLDCPCGRGQQDAYHLWRECDFSRGRLTDALHALEAQGLVPSGRLQQWQQMSLDARLHNVLSPHSWRASADDLEFKRTAAMQVVAAMSHVDSYVLPALNAEFVPGIGRLAVG